MSTPQADENTPEITVGARPKALLVCEIVKSRPSVYGGGEERLILGPWMGPAGPRWVHERSVVSLDVLRDVLREASDTLLDAYATWETESPAWDRRFGEVDKRLRALLAQLGEGG